jgi:hypothetical protein
VLRVSFGPMLHALNQPALPINRSVYNGLLEFQREVVSLSCFCVSRVWNLIFEILVSTDQTITNNNETKSNFFAKFRIK